MASFNVVQIGPDTNVHLRAFDEIAELLRAALSDLGHSVTSTISKLQPGTRNLVLGFHALSARAIESLPEDAILYNFEQIDPTSMMPPQRLGAFGEFTIWDYSLKNIEAWQSKGIHAVHVPLGHHQQLERLRPVSDPGIDVLFYGSMNERRRHILDGLRDAGLRVQTLFGVYGPERDEAIENAALVLNVHFYEARILETARLFYLLSNGIPVVSEWSEDLEVPEGLEDAATFARYEDLIDTVLRLAGDQSEQSLQGARGQAAIQRLPMTDILRSALERAPEAAQIPRRAPMPSNQKRLVFVLGAHRSGTSMVSRLVNLGGFDLTGPAIPPATDNPAGFWEDQRIAIIDDHVLKLLGSRWDDITPPALLDWHQHPVLQSLRLDLLRHLQNSESDHLVLKDPRITILYPMWQRLTDELGWKTQVVFSIRDPRAVAESLHSRNQFSRAKGVLIWLNYVLNGEFHSRSTPRILVDYDTLRETISTSAPKLHNALDMPAPLEAFSAAAAASVDSALNRSGGFDPADYDFPAAAFAREVYETLRSSGDPRHLDELRKRHTDAAELFAPMLSDYRRAISSITERLT